MTRGVYRSWVITLIVTVAAVFQINGEESNTTTDPTGELKVKITGLKSTKGLVQCALFDSKKSFLKKAAISATLEIEGRKCEWVVDDLPYGEYALAIYHDKNSNGKLDRRFWGPPKEPAGFANDYRPSFGPPKYEKAKFQVEQPETLIEVELK